MKLMGRNGRQIDLFQINRNFSDGLRQVTVEIRTAFFPDQLCNLLNRVHGSDFIVHMHDTDKHRIRPQRGSYIACLHASVFIYRKPGNVIVKQVFHLMTGRKDTAVLDWGCNDMPLVRTGKRDTFDCHTVGFTAARGKQNLTR